MTVAQIAELERIELKAGTHASADDGMCVMEAVAYFAGEPFSDQPQCVSPVISAFMRSWNDSLDDSSRQRLKAYVFRVMGTNTGASNEEQRAWLAIDWLVRTYAPTWFDLAGLKEYASALRGLPELTTNELTDQAQETIGAARAAEATVRNAARNAATAVRNAVRNAASDTTSDTAWDAATATTWAITWAAARDAARDAAEAVATDAAEDAARDAATKRALQPTVEALQISAFELLDRMIAVGNDARRSQRCRWPARQAALEV
jgi:hypothetical protein